MRQNIKNRSTRTILFHGVLALFFLFVFTDRAFSENTHQVVLIHVKSLKASKEFRLQSITDTTFEALKRGNRVIVLFDVEAVKAIKIGRWYGGDTTILDKVKIKDEHRKKLSNDLNISLASLPSNYGELFRLMRGKGVELYTDKMIMKAMKIEDEEFDTAFTPIDSDQIFDIFLNTDVYLSY
jgi:hypothetical protein